MLCDDLRDLEMAGVRWELTDFPFVAADAAARAANSAAGANENVAGTANVGGASDGTAPNVTGRVATSIVPPIAPIIPMSVETAAAMAARPTDMESLCRMIAEFNHPLRGGATNVVLPHVAPMPNGMIIITDIPGAEDDATGTILSGAAGELLDKMIGAIGMTRENVSILPMVFWRTPGGRTPSQAELDLARPFVDRAIELLRPRVILTLGTLPAAQIASATLPRGHGVPVELPGGAVCMPIYHPNYLILKPAAKRDAWTALQNVQNLLKSAEK